MTSMRKVVCLLLSNGRDKRILKWILNFKDDLSKARFKRRATAVPK